MKKKPAKPSRLTETPFPADARKADHALRLRCDDLSARLGHVERRLDDATAAVRVALAGQSGRISAIETRPSLWRRLARMWA